MTDSGDRKELEQRLERLESRVRELESRLGRQPDFSETATSDLPAQSRERSPSPLPSKGHSGSAQKPTLGDRVRSGMGSGEEWLNRIGIGLFLLGLAFLFKYSVDQGWIVPPVRSAIGLAAGAILLAGGFRVQGGSALRQLLLGGGIAAFYITGFATHYLYDFVPGSWMWAFMIGVTVLTLILSLSSDEPVLSVVGMIGGFGTPTLLEYGATPDVATAVTFAILLLAASSAIYWWKGWKSMVWIPGLGIWMILVPLSGLVTGLYDADPGAIRIYFKAATIAVLACLWAVPLMYDLGKSDAGTSGDAGGSPTGYSATRRMHMAGYAILVPFVAFNYGALIWDVSTEAWGVVGAVFAGALGWLYLRLRERSYDKLASMHGFTAVMLAAQVLFMILESPWIYLALTAEAILVRYMIHRREDEIMRLGFHLIYFVLAVWVISGLLGEDAATVPFLGPDAVIRLAVIAAAGVVVPLWQQRKTDLKNMYRIGGHLLFLFWLYRESTALADGQAYASLAWGAYAAVLLVAGFVRDRKWLRYGGMSAVVLLVGKMLLVDLSQLPAVWRILLFMGIGSAFLGIGYLWQTRWRTEPESG